MASDDIKLKYLFAVRYRDGSEYSQGADDRSQTHLGKSAWADVRQGDVELLALNGVGHQFTVDLRNGFFVLDNVRGALGENPPHSPEVAAFKPIYFRQVRREQVVGAAGISESVVVRYCIGWESQVDGMPVRQVFGVY